MNAGSAASVTDDTSDETSTDGPSESNVRLGRHAVVTFLAAGLLTAAVLYAALPASSFELFPPRVKQTVSAMAPEGWAFFTRSPRLPSPVPTA